MALEDNKRQRNLKIKFKKFKKLKIIRLLMNLLIFLSIFVLVSVSIGVFQNRNMLDTGIAAPGFKLRSLSREKFDLEKFQGKIVILHFWATWCRVCKMNIPLLNTLASHYKKDPVLVSVVADSQNLNKINSIYKEKNISYPVLLADQKILREYKINTFPTTYFINSSGMIGLRDSGLLSPFGLWWRILWLRTLGS